MVVCQSLTSLEDDLTAFEGVSILYGTEKDIRTSSSFCLRTVCVICCASLASMEAPVDDDWSPRGTV